MIAYRLLGGADSHYTVIMPMLHYTDELEFFNHFFGIGE